MDMVMGYTFFFLAITNILVNSFVKKHIIEMEFMDEISKGGSIMTSLY